jgi:hypothetical protein
MDSNYQVLEQCYAIIYIKKKKDAIIIVRIVFLNLHNFTTETRTPCLFQVSSLD